METSINLNKVDLSQFADDSGLWKAGNPHSNRIISELQTNLNNIGKWADKWGFKLSKGKTTGVIFSPNRSYNIIPPTLFIQGDPIKFEKTAKFLGMHYDQNLTWQQHINELIIKCNRDLNLLKNIKGLKWGADQDTLLIIYRALIRSKLDYGCQLYATANITLLKKLDKIQAQALKICTSSRKHTSKEEMQILTGESPLSLRREELTLRYAARLSIHKANHPTRITINKCNIPFSRKLVPRPPSGKIIHILCKEMEIDKLQAETITFPGKTPWNNKEVKINTTAINFGSKEINPHEIRSKIQQNLEENYKDYTKIYTDGSKATSPYKTSAAVVIPDLQIKTGSRLPDLCSVYTTEFWAILEALKIIAENKLQKAIIISDSLSVLKSLETGKSKGRENFLKKSETRN